MSNSMINAPAANRNVDLMLSNKTSCGSPLVPPPTPADGEFGGVTAQLTQLCSIPRDLPVIDRARFYGIVQVSAQDQEGCWPVIVVKWAVICSGDSK
jgi:hypothetical protein